MINNKKINTNALAKNIFVNKLKEKGINYTKRGTNFIVNGKEINVRGCDINNKWAQKTGPGWNRLNPKRFDYLVCITFEIKFDNIKCFIFSKEDVEKFPNVVWKNTPELINIFINQTDDMLKHIIECSKNNWEKILK